VPSLDQKANPILTIGQLNELAWRAHRMRRHIVGMATDRLKLHFGGALSMVEILAVLYFHWMRHDPQNPEWLERDRFILSKGHGAPGLYAALGEAGYFSREEFGAYRTIKSILQGHPDRTKTPGVEVSSGSLGTAFPVACGLALASQMDDARWHVYALLGDGECNEGSVWEAAQVASNLHLSRITAIIDRNQMSSYGLMRGRNDIEPLARKWESFNWHVLSVNGHDVQAIVNALHEAAKRQDSPTVVIANTQKGYGIPMMEKTGKHSFRLSHEEYLQVLRELDEQQSALRGRNHA
jgi:transketolase